MVFGVYAVSPVVVSIFVISRIVAVSGVIGVQIGRCVDRIGAVTAVTCRGVGSVRIYIAGGE